MRVAGKPPIALLLFKLVTGWPRLHFGLWKREHPRCAADGKPGAAFPVLLGALLARPFDGSADSCKTRWPPQIGWKALLALLAAVPCRLMGHPFRRPYASAA